MAIAQVGKNVYANDTSSPTSVSYTLGSGANLLVAFFHFDDPSITVSNYPTYGGQNLTHAVTATNTSGDDTVSIWYLYNPPTGANTFAASWSASGADMSLSLCDFSGVNTSGTVVTNSGSGTSASPAVSVTPNSANNLIVACMKHEGGNASSVSGTNHTLIHAVDEGTWNWISSYYLQSGGPSSYSPTYSNANSDTYAMGVATFEVASTNPSISVTDSASPGDTATLSVPITGISISVTDTATPGEVLGYYEDTVFPVEVMAIEVVESGPPTSVSISVSDGANPGEIITTHIPKNYIAVTDAATPGEAKVVHIPKNYISVSDEATPGEVIAARVPRYYISVSDGAAPGDLATAHIPKNYISVSDAAAPGEVVTPHIPKNYVSVTDAANPGEAVNIYLPNYFISVSDGAAPGETINVTTPGPQISVVDNAVPGETVISQIPKNYISVVDAAAPGENVTTQIPKNYISVLDAANPGEVIATQIPKNYVSVLDAATPGEVVNAEIPAPNTVSINVDDGASPGEAISTYIPRLYVSVLDAAAPGESVTAYPNAYNINVNDGAAPGETITAQIPRNYISVVDGATPGEAITIYRPRVHISVTDAATPGEFSNVSTFDILDYSPNANHLTNLHGVSQSTDTPFATSGYSGDFNGSSCGYITDAAQTGLDLSPTFTFEFWLKLTDASQYPAIISKDDDNQNSTRSYIALIYPDQKIYCLVSNGSGSYDFYRWETIVTFGEWHHWAITCNVGNPSATTFELFKDGVSQGNGTVQLANNISSIVNSTTAFAVGGRQDNGVVSNADLLTGKLDEVRIWNTVRTQPQIAASMTNELYGNETGLVAYYPFEPPIPRVDINVNDGASVGDTVTANIPIEGTLFVSVTDNTAPTEVVNLYAPKVYISVVDNASPGEVVTTRVSGPQIGVLDTATPSENVNVTVSGPRISVIDSTIPSEVLTTRVSSPRINVVDNTAPTDLATVRIPKNYINVTDQAAPGDLAVVHIPKNYINVVDAAAPGENINVELPAAAYYNINVFDAAAPGETVNVVIPINYISASDAAAPGEVVGVLVNNLVINVIDSLAAGEAVNVQPSFTPWYDILVIDVARPGDKRKVAKSHTGVGPKNPRDWYDEAPQPFQTKNTGGWYADNPKPYKSKNTPDWYEKY